MASLKDLVKREELFSSGHRACAGCGEVLAVRQVLLAAGRNVACAMPTGCLEIVSTIYPHTAWQVPIFHSAFENAAATISGMESAYRVLKRKGKIKEEIKFIAFAGDGGTYDIGFQALSGAIERRHRFLYVCTDNQAYMNTGIQRSSATPPFADTTTSPAGRKLPGKLEPRKDILEIVIAHEVPYAAQTTVFFWNDLVTKVEKALSRDGPTFINILVPCPLGWQHKPEETIEISRLAVETNFWPLYEYEDGVYRLNYEPKERKPIEEFLRRQGRFRHLFLPGNENLIKRFQEMVDKKFSLLKKKVALTIEGKA